MLRRVIWPALIIVATGLVCVLILAGQLPLGVAGGQREPWGWISPPALRSGTVLAGIAVLVYLAFVHVAARWAKFDDDSSSGRYRRAVAVASLALAAFAVQVGLQLPGYGLSKWPLVLYYPGPSGYYTVAADHAGRFGEFLRQYDRFQAGRGPFHLGTHPPGLIVLHYAALRLCTASRSLTETLLRLEPHGVRDGFALIRQQAWLDRPQEASIWLVALLSQLACALTVVPVYVLARRGAASAPAWYATACWPLVPAAALFMPKSDVLYPVLAAGSVALAVSGRARGPRWLAAGAVLWLGMFLSFAFMAVLVLLIVLLVAGCALRVRPDALGGVESDEPVQWANPAGSGLPGAGCYAAWQTRLQAAAGRFAALVAALAACTALYWLATGHNLPHTWLICYRKHAQFYSRIPRSYWPWVGFNLAEFAVALGLPLALCAVAGTVVLFNLRQRSGGLSTAYARLRRPELPPLGNSGHMGPGPAALAVAWWLTLLALNFSGKNLGEVARLWLFLMPLAVPAAAVALARLRTPTAAALCILAAQAAQAIAITACIQGFIDPQSLAQ